MSFKHSPLSLLGNNGILQNPAKFQFVKQEVDWSGFRITKDGVKPKPHISQSTRDFPTLINRTVMPSFMALVQQISYATVVLPRLLVAEGQRALVLEQGDGRGVGSHKERVS